MTAKLAVGDLVQSGLMVLPYADKRFREREIDGVIGNNFLARYNITANWHEQTFWLKPRVTDNGEMSAERMRRWGATIDPCKTPACVTATIDKPTPTLPAAAPAPEPRTPTGGEPPADPGAPATEPDATAGAAGRPTVEPPQPPAAQPRPPTAPVPAPTTTTIAVAREDWTADRTMDVLLEAMNADGTPIGLPLLRVTFPAGSTAIELERGFDMYQAAHAFRAVDWSPFPRPCSNSGQCAWLVRPPR